MACGRFKKPMPKRNPKKIHSQDTTEHDPIQQVRKDLEGLEQLQVMQLKLIREIRRRLNEMEEKK